jgi:dolichol-phosphate mannosyltransferase
MTKNTLIGIATYNESYNIQVLLEEIIKNTNDNVDILIVDDNSPDGTASLVENTRSKYSRIHLVKRKRKFGLGSAHKRIFQYAILNKYKKLVTMDADFSHSPHLINSLLDASTDDNFIIGSRYTSGGRCDYVGYRKFISISGNMVARHLLRIPSNEITTSFRVYSEKTLRAIDLSNIKSDGYAFFVEVLHAINQLSIPIKEIPIHFEDRKYNKSKIPKLQIVHSILNLIKLRLNTRKHENNFELNTSDCRACHSQALLRMEKYSKPNLNITKLKPTDFACTSVSTVEIQPPLHLCLSCNLVQIPINMSVDTPVSFYENVIDQKYKDHIEVKRKTFKNALKSIKPHIIEKKNKNPDFELLDVGSYYGVFLDVLKKNNIKAIGVEPCKHAYDYSKNNCSQEVVNKSLSQYVNESNKTFHLITSWDVIEHLDDVDNYLKEICKLLKKDGVFIFSTIFIDSRFAKILGQYWPWIIPMHFSYFSKESIKAALENNNLEIISESNYIHYAQISYAIKSVANKLPESMKFILRFLAFLVPDKWNIPFSFGDVKLIVAKKI